MEHNHSEKKKHSLWQRMYACESSKFMFSTPDDEDEEGGLFMKIFQVTEMESHPIVDVDGNLRSLNNNRILMNADNYNALLVAHKLKYGIQKDPLSR